MKSITRSKPLEEIKQSLAKCRQVYLIGCGTCATMCRTGGKSEVLNMKQKLEAAGKKVTGWMVIPTACDVLTRDALKENAREIAAADCILVMTCAFGVQTVARYAEKSVYPALNTLFIGTEETPGEFIEACLQCGGCVLGQTAGICPLVRCAKGLLNGPCGGSVDGKCEVSPDIACAWQMIYDRLAAMGRLDELEEIEPAKDWSTSLSGGPRQITIEDSEKDKAEHQD
ncbi:MAG TPA: methylenetetrahydrofolate reductase C-terminal domain-containing protein [Dehalococcoidales bacterium]|nr:methylenetetrahydrofolate reductase C-terminal domain-containing protein [Dehalococcoidales bacterium]